MIFSQYNKVVNALEPKADRFDTNPQSDIVSLKSYRHVTFLIMTGASADNTNTVTVQAGDSVSSVSTEIVFKYRKIISGDTYGALTAAVAGTGFNFTASTANQYSIVEVDAADVAAAGTDFDCVAVTVTEAGNTTAQVGAIVAILSEPRYPQEGLVTAITD